MTNAAIKQLPDQPDLRQLETEASDLLEHGSYPSLAEALSSVARRYGFPSWPKLKVYVESIGSMGKLELAIQDDDDDRVKLLLRDDPGLIHREGHWVKRRRHNGYLPLAYAAFFGKVNVMTALIEAGANVRDGEDKALRAAACFDQNLPAVELLIRHGADPNAATTSPSGVPYRVIDYPCMTLAPAMLDHLVSQGGTLLPINAGMVLATNDRSPRAKAECLRVMQQARFAFQNTPPMALHLRDTSSLKAHMKRDPQTLARLYGEEDIFPSDYEIKRPASYAYATPLTGGVTLLHMAVEFCDVELAQWLIEQGADPNGAAGTEDEGYGGWTPLFHAMVTLHVPRNFPEIVDLLLENGADPEVRASLRKPTPEGGEVTWRDVTPADYARRFIYPDLVNHDALQRVMSGGR